jgi:nucleotide-binding universal stress UspA family protein
MQSQFERVLIALDATTHDQYLLRYVLKMIRKGSVRRVYGLHVVPDFNVPVSAVAEFNRLFSPEVPLDERLRKQLQLTMDSALGQPRTAEISLDVIEGSRFKKLLHWIDIKRIDLLVVGMKKLSSGSGITARKVASHAPCSVLFVPEEAPYPVNRILVPVDFSEHSARAIKAALHWAGHGMQAAEIHAVHILDLIPAGYHLNQLEYQSFNKMLLDTALENQEDFIKTHQLPSERIHWHTRQESSGQIAREISKCAEEIQADAIFMGAQGHGLIQRFFFGSVTEKLLSVDTSHLVLVVR